MLIHLGTEFRDFSPRPNMHKLFSCKSYELLPSLHDLTARSSLYNAWTVVQRSLFHWEIPTFPLVFIKTKRILSFIFLNYFLPFVKIYWFEIWCICVLFVVVLFYYVSFCPIGYMSVSFPIWHNFDYYSYKIWNQFHFIFMLLLQFHMILK